MFRFLPGCLRFLVFCIKCLFVPFSLCLFLLYRLLPAVFRLQFFFLFHLLIFPGEILFHLMDGFQNPFIIQFPAEKEESSIGLHQFF